MASIGDSGISTAGISEAIIQQQQLQQQMVINQLQQQQQAAAQFEQQVAAKLQQRQQMQQQALSKQQQQQHHSSSSGGGANYMGNQQQHSANSSVSAMSQSSASVPQYKLSSSTPQNKYGQLLAVIDDLGRDIRPSYAGSRSAQERLKKGIVFARSLVRECIIEAEMNAKNS